MLYIWKSVNPTETLVSIIKLWQAKEYGLVDEFEVVPSVNMGFTYTYDFIRSIGDCEV